MSIVLQSSKATPQQGGQHHFLMPSTLFVTGYKVTHDSATHLASTCQQAVNAVSNLAGHAFGLTDCKISIWCELMHAFEMTDCRI